MLNKKLYELTNPQRSIWYTEEYFKGSSINNICGSLIIDEKVDFEKLKKAINLCLESNQVFQTKLINDGTLVKQYFDVFQESDFDIIDIDSEKDVEDIERDMANLPFNMFESFLFRAKLFRLKNGHGGLVFTTHHIISDAASFALTANNIAQIYSDLIKNIDKKYTFPSYLDYINTEEKYLDSNKFSKDEHYWNEKFSKIPDVASLPTSLKTISNFSNNSKRELFILPEKFVKQIRKFTLENKISMFNFFVGIFGLYVGKMTNLSDFVIGSPIFNRTTFNEKQTCGMFISTQPFMLSMENSLSFLEYITNISKDSLSILRHQKYPYQYLLDNLRKTYKNVPNLYDILISYQITKATNKGIGLPYRTHWIESNQISSGINIHLHDNDDSGNLTIAYDYLEDKYSSKDIINMNKRILNIINQVFSSPKICLKDIDIMTEEEKNTFLNTFEKTNCNFNFSNNIFEQIEINSKDNLNNIAIETPYDKISYKELFGRVNKLSNYLLSTNIKPHSNIGIFTNRSVDVIVGILAILKLGCTYVPIDPEYPLQRINYMIEKSCLNCILTDNINNCNLIDNTNINFVDIGIKNYEFYNSVFKDTISKDINDNLYIVFTSGSTGKPKGVTISHKNMLNLIYFEKEKTDLLHGNNRILQFATMSFDVSYQEIYSALLFSSTIVLVDEEIRKDSYKLTDYIFNKKIDTLFIPPAYLRLLTESKENLKKFKTYVKNIITAGEQLIITKGIRNLILSGIKIHNHYGPAETHVATTYIVNKKNIETKPPIGFPISNSRIYILNNTNKLCPYYTLGEIAIAGDCVGNGYFNNQDLTDLKFVDDIFSDGKMYLTGDLGYMDETNCVHYMGRADFQVKLNGFRVELEEIDKILMQCENVQNSTTIIQENNKKKYIITYYTENALTNEKALFDYLKNSLPTYMIPTRLIKLETMPLTPNGKIDKKALPKVDLLSIKKDFVNPKTDNELKLANIWKELFNTNKISTNYDFFEIGGDSLLAIKLSAKILDIFKINISVKDIFKKPVFSDLLNLIEIDKSPSDLKIQIAKSSKFYPLSSAQKRIYYTNSFIGEDNIVYNLPGGLLINTVLDSKKVEKSFNELIKKHSSFRTSFRLVENKPMQFIENDITIKLNCSHESKKNIKNILNEFPSYFDLSKPPLLHASMYILDNSETLILFDTHHIIVDGTSLNIVIKDFCDLYNNINVENTSFIDYKDYSVWESKQTSSKYLEIENYWVSMFKDKEIPVLNLPYDYVRPVVKSYSGNKITKTLDKKTFNKYIEFSKSLGVSPYMFFVSAFIILLYKYTNQENIIVGTPIAGRDFDELQDIVGMFVNNIVLSNNINPDDNFLDFIEKIKKTTLDALSFQPYPYDKLIKKLNLTKDISRNPLFDVMFIYQNLQLNKLELNGHNVKLIESKTNISKFDLSLEVIPNTYSINLEYCTDLFKKHTVEDFLKYYLETLNNLYINKFSKIRDINVLPEASKTYLLETLNNTYLEYPEYETISTLFEHQVEQTPNDVALVFHNSKLTYKELNEKANSLARYLRKINIRPNDIVGIMLPRSLELIISMLAVLKSGATYIPIDPMYPKSRTEYMLENSQSKLLLTSKQLEKNISFENKMFVDLSNDIIYTENNSNLNNINKPTDSSYVIYTSGSTGLPKGVVLNHKALVNLSYYLNNYVCFFNGTTTSKNIVSVTTASFDIFIFETLICLQKGLKVILADEEAQKVPSLLNDLILKENAEIIQMTPSRMQFLVDNKKEIPAISNLKYVVLAGEPLPIPLLKALRKLGIKKVYNGYGPSETTVFSTFTDVTDFKKMTIGKPLSNTQIYILDKNLSPVPEGVSGELYISGDGVGNGYLNKPDLTKERFIPNPFVSGKLMYQTGDSGKFLPNGEICYLERLDNQVKIRGLRIELEEIENKILKFPGVQKVKVIKQTIQNREFISAYFVANVRIRISDLRNFLSTVLPTYMVPSYFTALDDFPYTPNGKIDKKSLPLPKAISGEKSKIEKPKTKTQKALVGIWEKVLNISPIGIKDNFFELGGDSILAMNLHIELLKISNKIGYADIFNNPTILDLSNLIDKNKNKSFEKINKDLKFKYKNILNKCTLYPSAYTYKSPRNILLSGVTGFLGIHILQNFIENETGNIYCLIRNEPGLTTHIKLLDKLHFYFGNKYDNLIDKRIFIIKSNIVEENLGISIKNMENLANSVDTVINCAAKVSHYGSYNDFYDINVKAVDNLINFCLKYNKTFYQVSTLSVSGNSFVDQYKEKQNFDKDVDFNENDFYIGQSLNNVYIRTKFEAEKLVLSAINNGLCGYIFRVGNLMPRYLDGKFQQNSKENAYLNRLLGFLEIGSIPKSLLDGYLEFTPVDYTADAILKIISYPSKSNIIFHLFNDNHITIRKFINILKDFNYCFNIISDEGFNDKIKELINSNIKSEAFNNLLNDFDENMNLSYTSNIILKSSFSKNYLKNIGFNWPEIDTNYIQKLIICIEFLRKGDL